jgi:hypothetical protein
MDRAMAKARARRQERVAKVVWGTLFLVMGVLFTLHDMGRISLGETRHEFSPAFAVDGDTSTRWSSAFRPAQWLTIDLGEVVPVARVRLNWEAAHAKEYEIELSNDGFLWTSARHVTDSQGGTEDLELSGSARFVRVRGVHRATSYGYSLWEVQVFGPDGTLLSQGKTATASSEENQGPFAHWVRFWPLLLVAGGLPLLLAPRDDANLVFGLVMSGIGTYLELQQFGLVTWSLRQAASMLLVVIGLVILLQSQRGGDRPDGGEPGRMVNP